MIDKETIIERLKTIEKNISTLEKLKNFTLEDLKDPEKEWAVEHGLQITIQAVIDVGLHILSSLAVTETTKYRDVMIWLGKKGIIPVDLADKLAKMAGLRNILVHEYLHVDVKKVWNVLRENLDDLKNFCGYIYKFISNPRKTHRQPMLQFVKYRKSQAQV